MCIRVCMRIRAYKLVSVSLSASLSVFPSSGLGLCIFFITNARSLSLSLSLSVSLSLSFGGKERKTVGKDGHFHNGRSKIFTSEAVAGR